MGLVAKRGVCTGLQLVRAASPGSVGGRSSEFSQTRFLLEHRGLVSVLLGLYDLKRGGGVCVCVCGNTFLL